jgi:beta-lactamase class A
VPALTRRQLLLAARGPAQVYDRLAELEHQYDAYSGLFATDLGSGRMLAHCGDDPFAMCSTFKAYAAARVLQQVQRGELDLQQQVFIDPAALLPNSPVTRAIPAPRAHWAPESKACSPERFSAMPSAISWNSGCATM